MNAPRVGALSAPGARVPRNDHAWKAVPLFDGTALSERGFLALVGKRPGMYTGRTSFDRMVVFLVGYDCCAERRGGSVLDGFREWIEEQEGITSGALGWPGQVRRIAFPGEERFGELTKEEDERAVVTLFRLLDGFLAAKEEGRA
ncbi:hypothetical protein [Nocardiopsis dassonvillei]|uniref:hypothetical protein n=1 Tax=Nocardiopsis dassonvillei TaxID=2014 RepID=UPI003F55456F